MTDGPMLHPEAATTLSRLAAIGETMTTGWQQASAEITSLAAQLGKGELGAAFLAGYRQAAADAARAVDECCRRPGEFAAAGTAGVTAFTDLDGARARAIRGDAAG